MYQCDECPAEYTSAMAAAECGETDREDDARERQWLRAHPTGAVARKEVA